MVKVDGVRPFPSIVGPLRLVSIPQVSFLCEKPYCCAEKIPNTELILNEEALNPKFFHFEIMKPAGRFLTVQRKPTVSGGNNENPHPVGGEILPVNSLQLLLANFWWILLLAIPLLVYLLSGKYGLRLPRPVRLLLRLVPIFYRTLG